MGFSGQRDYAIFILNKCFQIASKKVCNNLHFCQPHVRVCSSPNPWKQWALPSYFCLFEDFLFIMDIFKHLETKHNSIMSPQILTTQLQQLPTFCHYRGLLFNFCKFMDIKQYTCYFLKILFLHFSDW